MWQWGGARRLRPPLQTHAFPPNGLPGTRPLVPRGPRQPRVPPANVPHPPALPSSLPLAPATALPARGFRTPAPSARMPLADRPPPPGQPPPFTCGLTRHRRCRAARSTRTRLLPPAPMGTRPHPSSPDRPPAVLRSSTKEMEQLGSGRLSPFQNGSFFAPVQSKADPSFRATRGPRTQAHNLRV